MTRTRLNFSVDALAFGTFLFLASTGVLLRYQLPPGSGGLHGRGTGAGEAQQTVLSIWSWTRHDWGAIHYWIACVLLAVLVFHLFLHWRWVVCVVRGKPTDRSGWRLGLGAIGLGALVLLAAAPWLSPTSQQTRAEIREAAADKSQKNGGVEIGPSTETVSDQFRGSMSLEQIAEATGLSVDYLVEQLGLPEHTPAGARIGPLLRTQGMHMSDLRRAVDQQVGPDREAKQDRENVR